MLHLTFDLELHDPVKKWDTQKKEEHFIEQERILKKIFSLINNANIKLTCFVTNEFIDEYSDFFHRFIVEYHEIAGHTANHLFYNNANIKEFIDDIKINKNLLEKETGLPCHGFRAPGGVVPNNLISILQKLEFIYDSSVLPGIMIGRFNHSNCLKNPYYPNYNNIFISSEKNNKIIEFPLLTSSFLNLSMNGIFFSLYNHFLQPENFNDKYGTLYLHPSDFKIFYPNDKTFFWDKIKLTHSYWKYLKKYISFYHNQDLSHFKEVNLKLKSNC